MKTFLNSLLTSRARPSKPDLSGSGFSEQGVSEQDSSNASSSGRAQARAREVRRLEPGVVQRVFRNLMDEHIQSQEPSDKDRLFAQIQRDTRRRRRGSLSELGASRAPLWRTVAWAGAPMMVAAVSLWVWVRAPETNDALSYSASRRAAVSDGRGSDDPGHFMSDPSADMLGKSNASLPLPGEMRRWVSGDEQVVLSFSDQSQVRLEPKTTLDVRILPSNRALFNLAEGKVQVNVHHQDQTDYRFQAGSYEVLVTGTAFELGFEPKAEHVALHMREGRVEVHSPNGEVRAVQGGESFERAHPKPSEVAANEQPDPSLNRAEERAAPDAREGSPSGEGSVPGERSVAGDRGSVGRRGQTGEPGSSYAALARDGKFSEIVQDAMGRGLNNVLSSKPPSELLQLSHAARYVGHTDVARPVLQALVQKYRGTSEGRAAVFFLGRISDGAGDGASAAQQYEQYLRVDPRGAYAPEALGRRMILVQRKNPELALKLAQDYLSRFPQGSYKAHAAALVKAARPVEQGSR